MIGQPLVPKDIRRDTVQVPTELHDPQRGASDRVGGPGMDDGPRRKTIPLSLPRLEAETFVR